MTKTKAQLRAEAVERLRWFESSDEGDGYYWDVTRALLGKRPTEYDDSDELVSALIDLLTDDCGPCYACAKLAELRAENSQLRVKVDELAEVLDLKQELVDELPERDALTLMRMGFGEMLDALGIDRNKKGHCTKAIHTLADMVERDYVRRAVYNSLKELTTNSDKWLKNKLEEARAERNELRSKLDELAERKCPGYEPESHHCRYHHQDFELNHKTVSRLKRENAELRRDLGECIKERMKTTARDYLGRETILCQRGED